MCSRFSVQGCLALLGQWLTDVAMKKLDQLVKEATPLRSYASELEGAITKVALVCDQDNDDNNIFPGKKEIIRTMANAVEKMRQVSAELDSINGLRPCCEDGVEKLGEVLEELVNMLDLDGSGIEVYLLQYVVDARQTLRAILQVLDDSSQENVSIDGKN